MKRATHTLIAIGMLLSGAAAAHAQAPAAQAPPAVSLLPADPARWDVAGHIGWFGGNKTEIAPEWNEWFDAASLGATLGYYWTPHVRLELDLATTTEGDVFSQEPLVLPGQPFPYYISRQHFFRTTTAAGGLSYQFFENAWFHPFAGLGVEAVRERTRTETQRVLPGVGGREPFVLLAPDVRSETSYTARPFAAAGFKWYLSERAFVRSDLRAAFSRDHAESVVWRVGLGVDF